MLADAVARSVAERHKHVRVSSDLILLEPTVWIKLKRLAVIERVVVVWDKGHIYKCTSIYPDLLDKMALDDVSRK